MSYTNYDKQHTLCLAGGLEAKDVGGLPVGISGPVRVGVAGENE